MLQLLEKIGSGNPQLTREIKGRLKLFPILVTSAVSLVVQAVVFLAQLGQTPGLEYRMTEKYCGIGRSYQEHLSDISQVLAELQNRFFLYSSKEHFNALKLEQVKIQLEQAKNRRITLEKVLYSQPCPRGQIDMTEWWRDHFQYIFQALSVIFIITLLVAGTYLLINNLAQEERRGTLNFIRLSPQSEFSVLTGKMLGVPILVYWFVALAIPFHIFAGIASQIPFSHILCYYAVLAGSCIFFFSAALLFSLTTRVLGGFQSWLGAGAVLMFLIFVLSSTVYGSYLRNGAAWFIMFSPVDATSYLFPNLFKTYDGIGWSKYKEIQFFYIPISTNLVSFVGIHLANYGLWTYVIWQGLLRRFRNPNTSVISKQQSYFLVAFVQILLWGFTLQQYAENRGSTAVDNSHYNIDINSQILSNLPIFGLFNFALLFGLIFILSQSRQTIQDWVRYRYKRRRSWWHNSLLRDLLFGEKSPAILAFALHLLTMSIPFAIWIFLSKQLYTRKNLSIDWLFQDDSRLKFVLGIVL